MAVSLNRVQTTPMAPYIGMMQKMTRSEKLAVMAFLADSLSEKKARAGLTDDNLRLDEALSRFHPDWGGEQDAQTIAENLRRGRQNTRTVETW